MNRSRWARSIAALLGGAVLALCWSSGETGPKTGGPNQVLSSADTIVIMAAQTFVKPTSIGTYTTIGEFEADTVIGKRYLVELVKGATPVTSARVSADSQEWVGSQEFGSSSPPLSKVIEICTTGTHEFSLSLTGSSGSSVVMRIVRVREPTYTLYGPQTFVRPASISTQTDHFSRADTAKTPFTMRVINGSPGGTNRITTGTVSINGSQVLGSSDFGTGIATIHRDVSLLLQDTLSIYNQSSSGTLLKVRITATDSTPPGIALASPVGDTIYTAATKVLFSGTVGDETPGLLRLNTQAWIPTPGSFLDSISTPTDGRYPVTIQATNSAKLTTTLNRLVIRDSLSPTVVTLRPLGDTTFVAAADTFTIKGYFADTTTTVLTVAGDTVATGWGPNVGFATTYQLDPGMNVVLIRATDYRGHRTEVRRKIYRSLSSETPADSVVAASQVSSAGLVGFRDAIQFLYTGGSPLQTGVAGGTILEDRAAVVRGRVMSRDAAAMPGVQVSVLGHPEFGYTFTRADGRFDLAVNGGSPLTIRFTKAGFLESQRQVDPEANDFAILDDVAMVGKTALRTVVNLGNGGVVRSRLATDANGDRSMRLFLKPGTVAEVKRVGGSVTSFSGNVQVRITEYTIGADGQAAMPAELPPSSAYAYCVDLTLDEVDSLAALDAAPSLEVQFTKPVVHYVRNILQAPIGAHVPYGYYDAQSGVWKADSGAIVIKIVALNADTALVDVTGDGQADSASVLNPLGFDADELVQLRRNYAVGDTLWRTLTRHFSPGDLNPNPGRRPVALAVGQGKAQKKSSKVPCPTVVNGSIIECESCVLGQAVPVVGTPFGLHYRSHRAQGYEVARTVRVPLWGASQPPAALRKIRVRMDVAGQRYEAVDNTPAANDEATLVWDGKDAYGRVVGQSVNARLSIGYEFGSTFAIASGRVAFNNPSLSTTGSFGGTGDRDRGQVSWSHRTITLGTPSAGSDGLGGWTISPHHFYDSKGRGALYRGDGGVASDEFRPALLQRITTGTTNIGASASFTFSTARLALNDIAFSPDGAFYVADELTNSVYRVAAGSNTAVRVAGTGSAGTYVDNQPGTSTPLTSPQRLALGPDGSVYFTMSAAGSNCVRVCRLDPGGTLRSIAGTGAQGYSGDGGLATQAAFFKPWGIALGPDGSVFVSDYGSTAPYKNRIRRIGTDGIVSTYAGGIGGAGAVDSTGPATAISVGSGDDLVADAAGNLYIASKSAASANGSIAKVAPDGTLSTLAYGTASTFAPGGIGLGPEGAIYVASGAGLGSGGDPSKRLFLLDPDGTIVAITGTRDLPAPTQFAGFAAASSSIYEAGGLDVAPDGAVYAISGEPTSSQVFKYWHVKPLTASGEIQVPSPDGSEQYYFTTRGLHLRTRDAMTGAIRFSFNYDAENRLRAIYDVNGDSTLISRDGSGNPTAIVAPFNRTTTLSTAGGFLKTIQDPEGNTISLATAASGLLDSLTDANGNLHEFKYWTDGRLKEDKDPAGGKQTLDQTMTSQNRTVTRTTQLGRASTYEIYDLYDGALQRRITSPDGLVMVISDSTDGRSRAWLPEGVSKVDSLGSNPLFGLLAPSLKRSTRSVPSGKTQYVDIAESKDGSFALPNPTGDWERETKVNFRTPFKTTFTVAGSPSIGTLVSITPLRLRDSLEFALAGRPITERVADLEPIKYAYDSHGRVIRVGQKARAWKYAYDAKGRLESVTDTLNRKSSFAYDEADRVTAQTLPDSQVIAFAHDANGNLTGLTTPADEEHGFAYSAVDQVTTYVAPSLGAPYETAYEYDDDHQLTQVTRPDGVTVGLSYGSTDGRLEEITIPRGSVAYGYRSANESGAGLVETIGSPDAVTLTYDYDGPLLLSERTSGYLADTVGLTYDNDLRPVSQSVNGGHTIALRYNLDGLLAGAGIDSLWRMGATGVVDSTALHGLSATSSANLNEYGELKNLHYTWNGGAFHQHLVRDALGRIATLSETTDSARVYAYVYTTAGRLKQVQRGSNVLEHYEYDANGNRNFAARWLAAGSDTASAKFDAQDRMTRYRGTTYTYTANGELLRRIAGTDTTKYTYDQLGNLLEVKLPGGPTVTYKVDGRNRRVAKLVDGTFKRGWIYQDGLRVVGELDSTGALAIRYVYGSRSHVPDYMVRYGTTYRLITDQLGSVRQVVDASSGTVAESIAYDAWGRITSQQSPGFVSVAYAGGLYDQHTGLVRFGARDYDASVGRWTAKDPLFLDGDAANQYAYAYSSPTHFIDSDGADAVLASGASAIPLLPPIVDPRLIMLGRASAVGLAFGTGYAIGEYINYHIHETPLAEPMYHIFYRDIAARESGAPLCKKDDTSRGDETGVRRGGGAEHVSRKRPSTKGKHEEGQRRKKKDRRGGEKGDARRPY